MEAAEAAAKSREGSAEIGRDLIEVAWDHVRSASGPFAPPGPTTYGGGELRDGLQPDGRSHYNGRMSIRMETTHAIDRPRSGVAGRSADASAWGAEYIQYVRVSACYMYIYMWIRMCMLHA